MVDDGSLQPTSQVPLFFGFLESFLAESNIENAVQSNLSPKIYKTKCINIFAPEAKKTSEGAFIRYYTGN